MTPHAITPEALKMAWKMVQTIFPRYSLARKEASALLTLTTLVSLEEFRLQEALEWTQAPPEKQILVFAGNAVQLKKAEKFPLVLKTGYSPREVDRALDLAERIFNRYDLPEIERATLFTALPCLGLHAIQECLRWKKEPPFAELE